MQMLQIVYLRHSNYVYDSSMNEVEKKEKVLVVEDDKFIGDLLARRFEKEGLNFELALDGEQALAKLRSASFSLIVLDLVLPGIDGYEVLKRLKADSEFAKIPVIILSNLGQKLEIERGLELGAIDFLVKAHLDLDEIVEKIKKQLEKKA